MNSSKDGTSKIQEEMMAKSNKVEFEFLPIDKTHGSKIRLPSAIGSCVMSVDGFKYSRFKIGVLCTC